MSDARKKQQWLILGLAVGGLLVVIIVLGQLMGKKQASFASSGGPNHVDETIIADRTSQASPELSWARQSREDINQLNRAVKELSDSVATLTRQQSEDLSALREEYDQAIVSQQAELNALKEGGLGAARPTPPGTITDAKGNNYGQDFITGGTGRKPVAGSAKEGDGRLPQTTVSPFGSGVSVDFALTPQPEKVSQKVEDGSAAVQDLRSYVPAGSYAPAVVISGVDASTGVSRDNPVPVLVRVTGPAVTAAPGHGTGRTINLTGCTVLGSAMGDLSSERVYVRLTKMTCLGKGDRVIEKPVAGLVAGSGKAGVRGHVVSREGNLATNAAIAGALGGFADAVSSAASIASSNEVATSVGSVLGAAGGGMVGGAASNAADRLAEYYIKRAEQYQPVVSLYAGSDVEVVFMEGVALQ